MCVFTRRVRFCVCMFAFCLWLGDVFQWVHDLGPEVRTQTNHRNEGNYTQKTNHHLFFYRKRHRHIHQNCEPTTNKTNLHGFLRKSGPHANRTPPHANRTPTARQPHASRTPTARQRNTQNRELVAQIVNPLKNIDNTQTNAN